MKKFLVLVLFLFSTFTQAQEFEGKSIKQSDALLMQPISVTVGGFFIVNGSFTASKTQRLDHFITGVFNQAKEKAIGALQKPETVKQVLKELEQYALRDITMKRANGEVLKIDLIKFRLTGDFKNNPYLMQDDVIIFPAYDTEKSVVSIDGAVNKITKFQFVQGDKLSDAIQFAGGLNSAYTGIELAEISRLDNSGNNEEIIKVKITDDLLLKNGDRIKILADENLKKDYKVLVLGEVNKQGYVFITKDGITLKQLIERAGGFKAGANLKRAELLRGWDEAQMLKMKAVRDQFEKDTSFTTLSLMKKTIEELQAEELKMYRASNVTDDEFRTSFTIDNSLRFIENKGVIDFTKIDSDSTTDGEFIVKEGDIIVVPEKQNLVYVFGQVVNPGYVNYEEGKDWKHYLNKAGGTTETAKDDDDIRIIKSNNRAWLKTEDVKSIEPGDFVYIPKSVPRDMNYYLTQIGSASSILATFVTLIFIIVQSTK